MPLDVVWGRVVNKIAADTLVTALEDSNVTGTLYLGYPVLPQSDSTTTVEALLLSQKPGLVAFSFPPEQSDEDAIRLQQDSIAYAVEGNLQKHECLRSGRRLGLTVNTVSFFSAPNALTRKTNWDDNYHVAEPAHLADVLAECAEVPPTLLKHLSAAIQRVTTIKPVKRRDNVSRPDSRGAVLKKIEREIANLDEWQRKAAIETPEGPQRVRGLAGSGKTVVLALKAAYLHAQHPEWDIAVTFHTRALSQQFRDLIERFSLEHSGDKPNWERLRILHSWGSLSEAGVYSLLAEALNAVPQNFTNARARYGRQNAFGGICGELLAYIGKTPRELFDAVLIDEAQDLPPEFLRLVFSATRAPKRIVWAYDELQNLSNLEVLSVEALFNGKVTINNLPRNPKQDIILPVCYRNTPWALTVAHGLGFGIDRHDGLVQLFDDPSLWREIGYEVKQGRLRAGSKVSLKRRRDSYPLFFEELLTPEDAVIAKEFATTADQYEDVADAILENIKKDELDADDILVILPEALTAKSEYFALANSFSRRGIESHLAGVSSSRDVFAVPGSVAVSQIYRAKGNEAPMVYVVNADSCAEGWGLISLRNTLFTAITRSRAWVRIYGTGKRMRALITEVDAIRNRGFTLDFKIPTKDQLSQLRVINRDRTPEETEDLEKAERLLDELLELKRKGRLHSEMTGRLRQLQFDLMGDEEGGS